MKKQTSNKKTISTQQVAVIVALIGLLGTIITALIGLLGTQLQAGAVSSPETQTPQIITPMSVMVSETASITPTSHQVDFSDVVDLSIFSGCDTALIIPSHIDPYADVNQALSEFSILVQSNKNIDFGPEFSGSVPVYLNVTSKVNAQWVKFSNKIKISITPQKIGNDSANIYTRFCGGGGLYRYFSLDDKILDTKYLSYSVNATSRDFDFFTLEPGEFELLVFYFQCGQPGLYQLTIEIPIEYQGETGMIKTEESKNILCPENISFWQGVLPASDNSNLGFLNFLDTYIWDGSKYTPKQ